MEPRRFPAAGEKVDRIDRVAGRLNADEGGRNLNIFRVQKPLYLVFGLQGDYLGSLQAGPGRSPEAHLQLVAVHSRKDFGSHPRIQDVNQQCRTCCINANQWPPEAQDEAEIAAVEIPHPAE